MCGRLHPLCITLYILFFSFLFTIVPLDRSYILSQPLAVESEVGFGELKQKMVAQGEEVIKKYKGLVPENNLSDVCIEWRLVQIVTQLKE